MLDQETRTTIMKLRAEGQGVLPISKVLKLSPNTVRKVLEEGTAEVPGFARVSCAEPHRERIIALHERCEGNLVRVQEELLSDGISIPYSTMTRFCQVADKLIRYLAAKLILIFGDFGFGKSGV